MKNLEKIFDFLREVEKLKSTLRYNKLTSGRQESTAEHSWRLSLMAFIIAEELKLKIDINKAVKISIVHDLAEAITGDIDAIKIAEGKVLKKDKQQEEIKAIKRLQNILPKKNGQEISSLWYEYEDGQTKEAKFIKALDKIETLTQLAESGYKIYDKPEFIANYADEAVENFPELKDTLKILKKRLKAEFKKGNIEWRDEYDKI